MPAQEMLLLTILSEAVLEDMLIDEIMAQGAKGYTITEARGRGTHGLRTGLAWTEQSRRDCAAGLGQHEAALA